jgi:hypothetical protein
MPWVVSDPGAQDFYSLLDSAILNFEQKGAKVANARQRHHFNISFEKVLGASTSTFRCVSKSFRKRNAAWSIHQRLILHSMAPALPSAGRHYTGNRTDVNRIESSAQPSYQVYLHFIRDGVFAKDYRN